MNIPVTMKKAVEHHRAGRLEEAGRLYRSVLRAEPRHPDASHNLGVLAVQADRAGESLALFRTALEAGPENGQYWISYMDALIRAGHPEEAARVLEQGRARGLEGRAVDALAARLDRDAPTLEEMRAVADLFTAGDHDAALSLAEGMARTFPGHHYAYKVRAAILKLGGDDEQALAFVEKALSLCPEADTYNTYGMILGGFQRFEEALRAYDRALEIKPDYVQALNNKGYALAVSGRREEALEVYDRALEIDPGFVEARYNKANVLNETGRFEAALEEYGRVLGMNPDHAGALNNMGGAFNGLGRLEEAEKCYRRAIELSAESEGPYGNLANVLEKMNRMDELEELMDSASVQVVNDPAFVITKSKYLRRKKRYDEALSLLRQALEMDFRESGIVAELHKEMGVVLNKLEDYDRAFGHFELSNRHASDLYRKAGEDKSGYGRFIQDLWDYYSKQENRVWNQRSHSGFSPVFLLGFPRSGTTLLDTILSSHARVRVVEEQPMLAKALVRFGADSLSYPGDLASLDEAGVDELRSAYLRELDRHVDPCAKKGVVIDKMPLSTVNVPLIQTMFPEARIILALRHPCDCVFSCFMNNFNTSSSMAFFLSLADGAWLYDRVMSLWDAYVKFIPVDHHVVRYEDVVRDMKGTVAGTLDFLGLEWDDDVEQYARTARKRNVNTPSYHQVVQPIYQHAKGRWEYYREHMAPVLHLLKPWIKRWGYPDPG